MLNEEALQHICEYMNDLMARDPEAMNSLLREKWECNVELADFPDTPIWADQPDSFQVTALGVICGMAGYNPEKQNTRIHGWWDGQKITHFSVTHSETPPLVERTD